MVIRMMGGLSLFRDGKTVATSDSRMKKVWTLIAYLVLHRNDPISLEELTGILWNGSECNNPSNALKNLAYRSRRMMEPLHREGEGEFIIFANGVYLWNPDISCRVDCEEMEECYRQASSPELSPQKRLALLEQGLDEYQGDFLPSNVVITRPLRKKAFCFPQSFCRPWDGKRASSVLPSGRFGRSR